MTHRLALAAAVILAAPAACLGHPGGLDSSGGHNDRKGGGYHYHGGGGGDAEADPWGGVEFTHEDMVSILRPSQREPERRPRMRARTEPPSRKRAQRPTSSLPGISRPARYHFHERELRPYAALEFEDAGEEWAVKLSAGQNVKLRKARIVRIEALQAKTDWRTWIDRSGKFSVVAKFVKLEGDDLHLETLAGKPVVLKLSQLSDADREFARSEFRPKS